MLLPRFRAFRKREAGEKDSKMPVGAHCACPEGAKGRERVSLLMEEEERGGDDDDGANNDDDDQRERERRKSLLMR